MSDENACHDRHESSSFRDCGRRDLINTSGAVRLSKNAMETGKRHLAALDSLRGVAVTLIFVQHYVYPTYYTLFGWIGVWIFFALSGYLITDGLLKMKALPIGQYFGRFYAKRAFRILPAFVVFVSISVALYFIFRREIPGGSPLGRYWIYIVTFTFNRYAQPSSMWFAHLWSLSLEEQFYVVWPWLVFFLPMNWLKKIAPCWILVAPVLRLVLPWHYGGLAHAGNVEFSLLCQADAFAIGGCVAIFRDELPSQSKKLLRIMTIAIIVIGLVNYFMGASARGSYWQTLGWPHAGLFNYQYVWSYSVINIWAATLILSCLQGTGPFILNFPPLVFLGRISYGAYLSHLPLLQLYLHYLQPINSLSIRGFVIFAIWFANVIVVAWLSFRFIELPFLRMKNRLGGKQRVSTRTEPFPELRTVTRAVHQQ
jgi:peptidoglycan/LPS O-acetylase OafA/YrhL